VRIERWDPNNRTIQIFVHEQVGESPFLKCSREQGILISFFFLQGLQVCTCTKEIENKKSTKKMKIKK
jgi:hypothetical protein